MIKIQNFEKHADAIKKMFDIVAVCITKHGNQYIFHVPFEEEDQLRDFLLRNNGDVHEMGFYARGFVDGEYIGENT